jgi:hypothetical protein
MRLVSLSALLCVSLLCSATLCSAEDVSAGWFCVARGYNGEGIPQSPVQGDLWSDKQEAAADVLRTCREQGYLRCYLISCRSPSSIERSR